MKNERMRAMAWFAILLLSAAAGCDMEEGTQAGLAGGDSSSGDQNKSDNLKDGGNSGSSKARIGLTDTLYAQIRFSVGEIGAEPVELTTAESLNALFLSDPRPELLADKPDARIESVELAQHEGFVKRRWDVNLYKTPLGVLDQYIEANRIKVEKPSDESFLTPLINMSFVREQMNQLDGLVVGGGEDVNPRLYFAKDLTLPNSQGGLEENVYARTRDLIELAYIGEALRQGKPILGICRGSQILAVALGGKLLQDIPSEIPSLQKRHAMPEEFLKSEGHEIAISANSAFARIMQLSSSDAGKDAVASANGFVIGVNSYHHQAVLEEFPGIAINAIDEVSSNQTSRSVVEGFIARGTSALVMGVQWHPERPFAEQGSTITAADLPFSEWKNWFQTDARRPYYRRIFENFAACAGRDRSRCVQ